MKMIEIMVRPDGQLRLETNGYQGSGCRTASHFLERALGRTTSEQFTAEYHRTAPAEQTQTQHQG